MIVTKLKHLAILSRKLDVFVRQLGIQIGNEPDRSSTLYKENYMEMKNLVNQLKTAIGDVENGGGKVANERHTSKGKLTARKRVDSLLDPGSAFLELSQLAAFEMYQPDNIASAGIVCGIGKISSVDCMVIANDATVKGGTYFPMTVKKHLRAQEIAWENRLPCVYLVDSGGANLPHQADSYPDKLHFGRIFFNQANMSAEGIVQISRFQELVNLVKPDTCKEQSVHYNFEDAANTCKFLISGGTFLYRALAT